MTVVTMILLGSVAVLTPLLSWRMPVWLTASFASVLLSSAAIAAAFTHKVHGVGFAFAAVLSVLAAAVGGIKIAPFAFHLARRRGAPADGTDLPQPLQGGLMIGLLERIAISVAILAHWPEGIAIVMAVKGLARYPELRDPRASEQFIIGTFASVLWAIAAGAIGRGLLS
ncbi:MAG: hypothetical protein LLG14_17825 [Nocardiaceae bacterium]|nr:hypothetical protein [Nocardiaceae bacterium]